MDEKKLCPLVRDLLPGLIDGVVSPETEAMLRAHLGECEECREMYEQLAKPEEPKPPEELPVEKFVKKHKRKQWLLGVLCGILFCILSVVGAAGCLVIGDIPAQTAVSHSWDGGYLITADGGRQVTEIRLECVKQSFRFHRKGEYRLVVQSLTALGDDGEVLLTITIPESTTPNALTMEEDGSIHRGWILYLDENKPTDLPGGLTNCGDLYMDTDWTHMMLWNSAVDSRGNAEDTYYFLFGGSDIQTATDAKNLITTTALDIHDGTRDMMKREIEKFH